MKNLIKYLLIVSLFMVYSGLSATDWNKTNRNFRYDKDVDNSMSADYTRSMTTVSYRDTLFNFVNYRGITVEGKIVQRKIYHTGTMPSFKWDYVKDSNIEHLKGLEGEDWQPAAVVFNDSLLLFVSCKMWADTYANGTLRYVVYNPLTTKWSSHIWVPGDYWGYTTSHGTAAVVLDNKLCVITHDHDQNVMIHWTKDLKTWNHFTTEVNIDNSSGENDHLSAVTATFTLDSVKKSMLVFAWRDSSKHPYTTEYYFNNENTLTHLRTIKISDSDEYSSVALAVGTISCPSGCPDNCVADPTSTHECVQAFLKREAKDNYHSCHRIKRFQLQTSDSIWRKIENNLLPQNDPNHYWASKEIPLTATVLAIPEGKNVRQFMCLVYRGYDGWNNPMNVAWAETNKLVYNPAYEFSQQLDTSELVQYIGYIEGPPPFYLNNMPLNNPYVNPYNKNISELEFTSSSSTSIDEKIGFDVKLSSKNKISWFNLDLSEAFGRIWGTEFKKTIFHNVAVEAQEEALGYYLTFAPSVTRVYYDIQDVYNNIFSSTYYFYLNDPVFSIEPAELEGGLEPDNPETYMYSHRPINFAQYNSSSIGYASNSWTGGTQTSAGISIEQGESITTTKKATIAVGVESKFGEIFEIGAEFEGSFDYELETKTSIGNEIKSSSGLNEPMNIGDVTHLNYTTYWMAPSDYQGIDNWWLREGAEDQKTWCITYQVTTMDTLGGVQSNTPQGESNNNPQGIKPNQTDQGETGNQPGNTEAGQELSNGFSLSQNYPDPFSGITKIKYQIGNTDLQNESGGGQGIPTKLLVYNMTGTLVATLVNDVKESGNYEINWNASHLQPGMYFYSLQAGTYRNVKKLIIMK